MPVHPASVDTIFKAQKRKPLLGLFFGNAQIGPRTVHTLADSLATELPALLLFLADALDKCCFQTIVVSCSSSTGIVTVEDSDTFTNNSTQLKLVDL